MEKLLQLFEKYDSFYKLLTLFENKQFLNYSSAITLNIW